MLVLTICHPSIPLLFYQENMVIDLPRQRKQTKRYGNMDMVELTSSSSDSDQDGEKDAGGDEKKPPTTTKKSSEGGGGGKKGGKKKEPQVAEKPSKKQLQSGWTRLECFRVEKGLLTYG